MWRAYLSKSGLRHVSFAESVARCIKPTDENGLAASMQVEVDERDGRLFIKLESMANPSIPGFMSKKDFDRYTFKAEPQNISAEPGLYRARNVHAEVTSGTILRGGFFVFRTGVSIDSRHLVSGVRLLRLILANQIKPTESWLTDDNGPRYAIDPDDDMPTDDPSEDTAAAKDATPSCDTASDGKQPLTPPDTS